MDFFDTAEIYGSFVNEELVGRAVKDRCGESILATKLGFDIRDGVMEGKNSQPKHIREVAEVSLTRMGVDHIDLFYQHRVDPNVPIEDVTGAVGELVKEGRFRVFGMSEAAASTIRRVHAVQPIIALQSEYSLWEREVEQTVLPCLRKLGIGLVAFSPLGCGFLTGNVVRAEDYREDDYQRKAQRFQGKNFDTNVAAVEIVRDIATAHKVTASQVEIAWLLQKGDDIVPIPGVKRHRYLEENAAAPVFRLDAEEILILYAALATGAIHGQRYSERSIAMIER